MKSCIALILFVCFWASGCKKENAGGPACAFENNFSCAETVPPKESCGIYYESWFYDSNSGTCQKIRYSGCRPRGFTSKESCDSCACRKE